MVRSCMIPDASVVPADPLPPDWSERLHARLASEPEHRPETWRIGGARFPQALLSEWQRHTWQPAAVLVPIIARPGAPSVLLTVRAEHLRRHAGQISFPGGRSDATDPDLLATALREAAEEIGLDPELVRPAGYLSDHIVLTGFQITPVVALIDPQFRVRLDATEVSGIFEVPLKQVVDATRYESRVRVLRERNIEGYEMNFDGHQIWGATAGILRHLREVLLQEVP